MNWDTDVVKKAYACLQLERRMVGVKLIYNQAEYESLPCIEPKTPLYYCQAVHAAASGHSIKLTKETSGCPGSSRALGFTLPAENYYTGAAGENLGLYADREVARQVASDLAICTRPLLGIAIRPLEEFDTAPDVVLVFVNTREAMRILQGYTCVYGLSDSFCMSGNQAVCVECTTYPFLRQRINLSMFCAGTRHKAQWNDGEAAFGIPAAMFSGVVQGLEYTVNAIERNKRKAEIEQTLDSAGLLDFEIEFGHTYFLKNDVSPRI
ncbi:MAG: DUF169 domain-containing protein [Clostridiaceae bacterium]|nr:DUF169 domain-containing protein [Clostridiaceae bacterium]